MKGGGLMELMTISEVTKTFNVTTRALRYYDEIGLLPCKRIEGYAYRVYDEAAVRRLQQIITLRKLRVPLKKIAKIFSENEQAICEVFQECINELDEEINALTVIRDILSSLITRINTMADTHIKLDIFHDADIMSVIQTLSLSKINLKEEYSMDDLNKANDILSAFKDVRILYLPPSTVAASHYFGENPEANAFKPLNDFVRGIQLHKIKPDLRIYGFNNPTPTGNETYGYEFWVTIPDDLEVPAPLQKKYFAGGLYAAHHIKMGNFHEWESFGKWIMNCKEYEYEPRDPMGMNGALEEHLNAYAYFLCDEDKAQVTHLDLLIPVRERQNA